MPIQDLLPELPDHQKRVKGYNTYRNYWRGQHELRFATPDFKAKHGHMFEALRQNLCPAVVSATTNRLQVRTWGNDAADKAADVHGLSRLVAAAANEMVRCGDAYTLTWPGRDGTPKARYHRADQIIPHVDPLDPDRLDWAAKVWMQGRYGRATIYYRDRAERWRTREPITNGSTFPDIANAWTPHTDADGSDTIPHPFEAVPVCWFKREADEAEEHGISALADVIPLQDALNKGLADILVLSEAYARPFWYLLNHQPKSTNPFGQYAELQQLAGTLPGGRFDPGRQQIFTTDGPGPFGQLDPPNIADLLAKQTHIKEQIAAVAGIPTYYFAQTAGQIPSGESLRVLSSRLIAAVTAMQAATTPVWRGQAQLLGLGDLTPQWHAPQPIDETELIANAEALRRLGLAWEDVIDYLGLPDRDGVIERARQQATQNSAAVGRALAAGTIPTAY